MKKSLYLGFAIAAIAAATAVSSCKKNDGGSSNTIVGDWELRSEHEKTTYWGTTPPTVKQTDTTYAAGTGDFVSIRADNTYISRDFYASPVTRDSGIYSYNNGLFISTSRKSTSTTPDTVNLALNGNDFIISGKDSIANSTTEYTTTFSRR